MPVKNQLFRLFYLSLIALIIIGIGGLVYLFWPELIVTGQQWQRYFHQQLIQFLLQVKTNPLQTGVGLMLLSLLYGMIHSAGPGHGKVIIVTYLATQPSQLKKSLMLTILSALMQGFIAILLVSMLVIILNQSAKYLKMSEYWLELISYILIMLVGVFLCYRAIKKLIYQTQTILNRQPKIIRIRPITNDEQLTINDQQNCHCCHHKHLPTQEEINQSKGWTNDLAIIFSIGIRPCSSSLLVLVFSYTIGIYYWGILATIMMSIGTAITTSLFALLVYCSRKLAQYLVNKNMVSQHNVRLSYLLSSSVQFIALFGGIIFIVMGLILCVGMSYPSYSFGHPLLR